ncbi:MAG TPA: IS1595 family transposase [Acetobacteraceae bacterium]|nr:IS1595 family transposase [Acetobacteraceae bacterium]
MTEAVDLTDPIFHNEDAARRHIEAIRWPIGPACPHCGVTDDITPLQGRSHRAGLYQCNGCRGHFTVTNGTVTESGHIPLAKWVLAFHLMAASKKGVSAHQLHRMLHITYKSAWFTAHRVREAMRDPHPVPLGGEGKVIEADEAYHGKRETPRQPQRHDKYRSAPTKRGKGGGAQKRPIVALIERGGEARAVHMNTVTGKNVREFLIKNASRKSRLHTDESSLYPAIGEFAKHETVNHAKKEYARGKGDDLVTTNWAEGFFGVFKRGMTGVYQHCGEQHLQRYLDEFTFRYNNRSKLGTEDTERAVFAIKGAENKRLTYRGPYSATNA